MDPTKPKVRVRRRPSTLRHVDGDLPVRILQCPTGVDPLRGHRRADDGSPPSQNPTAIPNRAAGPEDLVAAGELLGRRVEDGLTAIGWHPGLHDVDWGDLGHGTVAAGLGQQGGRDLVRVVGPDGVDETADKTCLSQNDLDDGLRPGDDIVVFERPPGPEGEDLVSWAVLNCFEYTHPAIVGVIEQLEVEVVVVLSANIATRQYWENALADVHRLFAFVVIANIAECGGSGVFGPIRRSGTKETGRLTVGGQLLGSRGPGAVELDARLSIGDLRVAKQAFATAGFDAIEDGIAVARPADMMVPSQRYIDTGDEVGCGPVSASVSDPIALDWHDGDTVTVGVAQVRSAGTHTYRQCGYRLDTSPERYRLGRDLEHWLDHATEVRSPSGRRLDMLLLPEVFVPRSLVGRLRDFAGRHRCTVVAGFDYEPEPAPNANECAVFPRDGSAEHWYRKVTRSQYDGIGRDPDGGGRPERLRMERGSSLLRFASAEGRSFGVLICYDFSHISLMNQINLGGREEPLDLLAVVAHNPFGQLYRSGCLADAHRFYQYVAMCNVATYGGSGIFAPMRLPGPRQVLAEVGVGTEAIAVADLDLDGLQRGRAHRDRTASDRFMNPSAVGLRTVEEV